MANKYLIRALILLGLVQSIAFTFDLKKVKGLATVTVASPLALVFSNFRGVDTYALDFTIVMNTDTGETITEQMTPALYGKLKGPYNIRNVYGAAISYGAKFESEKELALLNSVLHYGVCSPGDLLRDFDMPKNITDGYVLVQSKRTKDEWRLEFSCKN